MPKKRAIINNQVPDARSKRIGERHRQSKSKSPEESVVQTSDKDSSQKCKLRDVKNNKKKNDKKELSRLLFAKVVPEKAKKEQPAGNINHAPPPPPPPSPIPQIQPTPPPRAKPPPPPPPPVKPPPQVQQTPKERSQSPQNTSRCTPFQTNRRKVPSVEEDTDDNNPLAFIENFIKPTIKNASEILNNGGPLSNGNNAKSVPVVPQEKVVINYPMIFGKGVSENLDEEPKGQLNYLDFYKTSSGGTYIKYCLNPSYPSTAAAIKKFFEKTPDDDECKQIMSGLCDFVSEQEEFEAKNGSKGLKSNLFTLSEFKIIQYVRDQFLKLTATSLYLNVTRDNLQKIIQDTKGFDAETLEQVREAKNKEKDIIALEGEVRKELKNYVNITLPDDVKNKFLTITKTKTAKDSQNPVDGETAAADLPLNNISNCMRYRSPATKLTRKQKKCNKKKFGKRMRSTQTLINCDHCLYCNCKINEPNENNNEKKEEVSGESSKGAVSAAPSNESGFSEPSKDAVCSGLAKNAVCSGPAKAAVSSGPTKAAVSSGSQKATISSGPTKPAVSSGPQKAAVCPGPAKAAVSSGPPKATISSGPQKAAVCPGPAKAAVSSGPPKATISSGQTQPAVSSGPPKAAVSSGPQKAVVSSGPQKATVSSGPQKATVSSGPQKATVPPGPAKDAASSAPSNATINSKPSNDVITPKPSICAVFSGVPKSTVASLPPKNTIPAVPSKNVSSGPSNATISAGTPNATVSAGPSNATNSPETQNKYIAEIYELQTSFGNTAAKMQNNTEPNTYTETNMVNLQQEEVSILVQIMKNRAKFYDGQRENYLKTLFNADNHKKIFKKPRADCIENRTKCAVNFIQEYFPFIEKDEFSGEDYDYPDDKPQEMNSAANNVNGLNKNCAPPRERDAQVHERMSVYENCFSDINITAIKHLIPKDPSNEQQYENYDNKRNELHQHFDDLLK